MYSITKLMSSFRQALVALVPSAEDVGVKWRDGEAYDEWDLIEDVLFEVYVASAVRAEVSQFRASKPFAEYGMSGVRYSERSWFEVLSEEGDGPLALIRLNSPGGLGGVQLVRLDEHEEVCEHLVVKWTPNLQFGVRLRTSDGRLARVEVVTPTEPAVERSNQMSRRHPGDALT